MDGVIKQLKLVSVVIPVFNNAGSLPLLFEQLQQKIFINDYNVELIFVDDNSTDNSVDVLLSIKHNRLDVVILHHTSNSGQVPAILSGLKYAKGDCCIIISADMQEPALLIPKMIGLWRLGFDAVIATRNTRRDGFANAFISKTFFYVLHFFSPNIPQLGYDFALIDKGIIQQVLKLPAFTVFLQIEILKAAKRTATVDYERTARLHGKSQWRLTKKMAYAANSIVALFPNMLVRLQILSIVLLLACAVLYLLLKLTVVVFAIPFVIVLLMLSTWMKVLFSNKVNMPQPSIQEL